MSSLGAGSLESVLQWSSVSGRPYFVAYSTNLTEWFLLPGAENIPAVDISTEIADTNLTDTVRFYRAGVFQE